MAKDKKDNILEVDVSFSTKMDDFKERFMDWQWKVREIRGQKMRFKDFNHRDTEIHLNSLTSFLKY